jgi:hypothetical protein
MTLNVETSTSECDLVRFLSITPLSLLLIVTFATASMAQWAASPAQPALNSATPQDLAKDARNPFADNVNIPIESTTGFRVGPHRNTGESIDIQPILPFSLTKDWDLIARPLLTATYLPSPSEEFGLEDSQIAFFLTPDNEHVWLWGVGPIFQLPTATNQDLGTGRWSVGPTAAAVYDDGPWLNGIQAYQLMSFAGDRNRGSVNQTLIQPLVSYNFDSGWFVQSQPSITYDWTAEASNAWTIPIGADVGRAFKIGVRDISLQIGSYDFIKHPDDAPQWMIRTSITFLFPAK